MTKFKDASIVLAIALLIVIAFWSGYATSNSNYEKYHYQVMKNQWQNETKRLQYAYNHVDACATDDCLETWRELIGEDIAAK